MSQRQIQEVKDGKFSKIVTLIMEGHREHDLTKEESIGYVVAKMNTATTVGEINYVIQQMAIAWASPV
jgi:hypothetical protein